MVLKQSKSLLCFFLTLLVAAFIALPGLAFADDNANGTGNDATATENAGEDTKGDSDGSGVKDAKNQNNAPVSSSSETPAADATNQSGASGATNDLPVSGNEVAGADGNGEAGQGASGSDADQNEGNASETVSDATGGSAAENDNAPVEDKPAADQNANGNQEEPVVKAAATTAPKATTAKSAAKTSAKKAPGQLIADGWYFIQSKKLLSLVLATNKGGKNAAVKTDKGAQGQQWFVKYNPAKKAYTLYNKTKHKYLSIKSTKKGANVRLVKSGSNAKSFWVISSIKGGYTLKAYSCKYLLDINGGKKIKNGANVDIDKRKKSGSSVKAYQRWLFLPVDVDFSQNNVNYGNGYYTITLTNASSTSVSVPNSSKSAGTQLATSGYAGALNQKYVLHKESDGTYTLQSIASAKYLTMSGSKVVQENATGDDSQKWRAVSLGNGVALVNVATNKSLAISGSKAVAGNPANVPSQRFNVSKKNLLDNGNFYIHIASGAESTNVMTVNGGSKNNNASLSVQKKNYYNDNGSFSVKHLGNDVYVFTNVNSGKQLIASGSNAVQGAASGNNYKWKVALDPNGGVTLTNEATHKLLSAGTSAGSTVTTQSASGAETQTWHVEKAQVLNKYQKRALKKILKRGSKKNYYLFADLGVPRMMVWERANKNAQWRLKYDYTIAYGRIEGGKSRTPTGDYTVHGKLRWLDSAGDWNGYWSAPWAVRWSWAWFHARTHAYKHSSHVVDKRLGLPISNGCIRQPDKYAKWIYDNHKRLRGASVTVWKNGRF